MTTVFCRVTADLSEQFVQMFPHQFDFQGLLQKIAEDAGVTMSSSDSRIQNDTAYSLQGLWPEMEKAYNMLVCVYGSVSSIRCEQESSVPQGSRPFSALVEAAEAISRGADLQEQVENELALIKDGVSSESFPAKDDNQIAIQHMSQETDHLTDDNEINSNIANENFTKVKDRQKESFALDAETSSTPVKFTEAEGVEYRSKGNSSVLNVSAHMLNISAHDGVKDKIYIEESVAEQFKESSTIFPQYDYVLRNDEVSKSETKKTVPVKKRQARRTVQKMEQEMSSPTEDVSQKETKPSQSKLKQSAGQVEITTELMSVKTEQKIEKPLKVKDATTQFQTSEEEEYFCEFCDFVGKNRKAFSDHTQSIHLAKQSQCDICNKVFPNERYMKRHRNTHSGPNHRCDQCGKMYKVQKALRNHIKRHDATYKPPEFKCDMCHKSFCNNYILECHKRSEHLGIKKSFLCSTCGKSFTTKHTLQQHVNVHIGARPYKCDKCDKAFSYESALRDHKFIHDGIKQFICCDPSCYKAFRQRSALKMHEKIHKAEKDFICCECGRGFTQKQALQRHIRAHKGDKPFWCKICLRSFGDASIIRRHMILVHKIHKDITQWREDIVTKAPQQKNSEEESDSPEMQIDQAGGNPVHGIAVENVETNSVISVTEVENQNNFNTQVVTTPTKTTLNQIEFPPISAINNKYKTFEGLPIQILQLHAADHNHHHHIVDLARKDQTAANSDESPEDLAMHYPTISVFPSNVAHTNGEVLNYEYIVTPDDPTYQLARTSEIDHTDYAKAALVDKSIEHLRVESLPKHHDRSEIFDASTLTLVNTTPVTHLTDSTRELMLPEVSSVLAGTSSQDDLIARSLDQLKVRQEVLSAERIMDIAKQLQEADTTVVDSQQLQALYSYYGALASQYLNLAQYSTLVPTTDGDHP